MEPFVHLLLIYLTVTVYAQNDIIYYISKNGIDWWNCGNSTNPCGTFYHITSELSQGEFGDLIIYVIDGQNVDEIERHFESNTTHGFNPCFPLPVTDYLSSLEIYFNSSIQSSDDWLSSDVCRSDSFDNTYMFQLEAGSREKILKITNLNLNDYHTSAMTQLGIMKAPQLYCYDCSFINVTIGRVLMPGYISAAYPFHTISTLFIVNGTFINFRSRSDLFYTNLTASQVKYMHPHFLIQNSTFMNIFCDTSLIQTSSTSNDSPFLALLTIDNVIFDNIAAQQTMINDEADKFNVSITNTIMSINVGGIYFSEHYAPSKIQMSNVSIYTHSDKITFYYNDDSVASLFRFSNSDIVRFDNVQITYSPYNGPVLCLYNQKIVNYALATNLSFYHCQNPVPLIQNYGRMYMKNINVSMQLIDGDLSSAEYEYTIGAYESGSLIQNEGEMDVVNMYSSRPFSSYYFSNTGTLSINGLSFGIEDDDSFNPNNLFSTNIIKQKGNNAANLILKNSQFIGTYQQISLNGGKAQIINCTFSKSTSAIIARNLVSLSIKGSLFKDLGQYDGPLMMITSEDTPSSAPIDVSYSQSIEISNNNISALTNYAVLQFEYCKNMTIAGNTFVIDAQQFLFYELSSTTTNDLEQSHIVMSQSNDSKIISNDFKLRGIDSFVSITYFYGIHCLAANTFYGTAFSARFSSITSCNRPHLLSFVTDSVWFGMYDNMPPIYGDINPALFDKTSHIFLDYNKHQYPFWLDYSLIALDNLNISVVNAWDNIFPEIVTGFVQEFQIFTAILLIDSYINGTDISYPSIMCDLKANDRLRDDSRYIAKLFIDCPSSSNYMMVRMNKTMDSPITKMVDHLSITKLNFTVNGTKTYYPGQLLKFEYEFLDILNNKIDLNKSKVSENVLVFEEYVLYKFTIRLDSDKLSTQIGIDPLTNDVCNGCKTSINLNDVLMREDFGKNYTLGVMVDGSGLVYAEQITGLNLQTLISEYAALSLQIIGCPIGFGPDPNNVTCIECGTGKYNLLSDNVNECKSCHFHSNEAIKCSSGNIEIPKDFWIGFDQNGQMISSRCPPFQCCQNKEQCHYTETETLCAKNRDDSSVLCGKCKEGYSESMRGSECVKCDEHKIYFLYLLYPMFIAFAWFIYLILITSETVNYKKQNTPRKPTSNLLRRYLSNEGLMLMIKTMWNRNLLYYEQSLSQILSGDSLMILFSVLSQIFNLSLIGHHSNGSNSWCFMDGLNGKQKILLNFLLPFIILLYICLFYLYSLCKKNEIIIFKSRKVNFGKLFCEYFLFAVGSVVSVLFLLLNCQSVGDKFYHFYFGYEECYGLTWTVSFLSLMFILCAFSMIFLKLKRMNVRERYKKSMIFNSYINKYKKDFYYFEFVIFVRRICIAMFCGAVNNVNFKSVFVGLMILFLMIQNECKPFVIGYANKMESFLLCCLLFVIVLGLFTSIDRTYQQILTTIFILIPFPLFAYFLTKYMANAKNEANAMLAVELIDESSSRSDTELPKANVYKRLQDGDEQL